MGIELSGYGTVLENEVYVKDRIMQADDGQQAALKEILILRLHTEITEDDVVKYLQRKAEEVAGAASLILPESVESERSGLEKLVMKLPDNVRNDIRAGNKECLRFIRAHTPAKALEQRKSPNQYLHVRRGLIPDGFLKASREAGGAESAKWYDAALSYQGLKKCGLGEQWAMKILLQNQTLPDKGEITILAKHGAYSSRTLDISAEEYSPEEAISVIEAVYHGLSSREKVDLLHIMPDYIIEPMLQELAVPPLIALHEMIMANMAAQNELARRTGQ